MAKFRPGNYKNGRIIEYNGAYIFIPKNLSKNVTVTICNPGQDSFSTMCSYLSNPVLNQGTNQIIVVPKYAYGMYRTNSQEKTYKQMMNYINQICKDNNVKLTTLNTIGVSAGDKFSLKEFAYACRDGVDNGFCVIGGASTIHNANQEGQKYSYGPNWAFLSDEEYSYMKGRTVYVFESKNGKNYSYIKALLKHDINVVLVSSKRASHSALCSDLLTSNIFNMLDGDPSNFLNNDNYSFWRCTDPNKMTWVAMSDDEVREAASSNLVEALYEKCENLADFADRYMSETNDTLASNLVFVSNSMNGLKSKITSHQDINYTASKTGEAGIVGTIYSATNYYGTVTNILYGNLSAEADAVYAIANAIYKMDGCGAVIAESGLTDAMKSMYSDPSLSTNIDALKKATSELYDTAKTAVMASGRYDELSNILGSKITPGGVGNISITALESAINSVVPSLDAEVDKANQLKSGVSDFMAGIGSSSILQGGAWEDVKTNMSNYENLLDANSKAATFISDTLKTAMGMITNYIEEAGASISAVGGTEYSGLASAGELDDSKIPELNQAIEEVKTNIETVETKITEMENATERKCDPLPEGSTEAQNCYDVKKYTAADIQPYKDKLEKYKEVLETLNTYLGKLEGLAPVVQAAQEIIQSAIDQVKNMYENPVKDANGNQSFVADFKLDLSPYAEFMDITKDYKKLIDDYYEKLNPPAEEPQTEQPAGENPEEEDPPTYYGPPAQDPPTITTEAPSETTTEETTEEATEEATEESTEESTEEETVPPITEPITDIQTEPETVPETKPVETEPEQEHGGGHEPKPPKPGVETEPVIMTEPEMFTEMETIPEEIYTEPEDYSEPFMEPDTEIFIDDDIIDDPLPEPQKKGNGMKTMGVAAGLGLAIGAAALGAHTIIRSKEDDDEESDYGYEK